MHPDEARHGRAVDAGPVEVAARRGDDTPHEQAYDYGAGLHHGRPPALAQDYRHENGETEALKSVLAAHHSNPAIVWGKDVTDPKTPHYPKEAHEAHQY